MCEDGRHKNCAQLDAKRYYRGVRTLTTCVIKHLLGATPRAWLEKGETMNMNMNMMNTRVHSTGCRSSICLARSGAVSLARKVPEAADAAEGKTAPDSAAPSTAAETRAARSGRTPRGG